MKLTKKENKILIGASLILFILLVAIIYFHNQIFPSFLYLGRIDIISNNLYWVEDYLGYHITIIGIFLSVIIYLLTKKKGIVLFIMTIFLSLGSFIGVADSFLGCNKDAFRPNIEVINKHI